MCGFIWTTNEHGSPQPRVPRSRCRLPFLPPGSLAFLFFGSHSPAQAHPRVSALLRGSGLAAPRDVLDTSSLLSLLPPALCTLAGAHIGMTQHVNASTVATPSVAPIRAGRPGRAALMRSVGLGVEAPPLPPWPPALYLQLLVCFLIFFSLSQCSSRSSR